VRHTRPERGTREALTRAHARRATIGKLDKPEAYIHPMIVNEFISARRQPRRLMGTSHMPPGRRSVECLGPPQGALGCTARIRPWMARPSLRLFCQ